MKKEKSVVPAGRLRFGAIILIIGFLSPLLIPVVVKSGWSTGVISVVSGLLAFGIPELFMVIAVGIMGKDGFNYLRRYFSLLLRRYGPPDEVSPTRYRIGLFMFSLPLIISMIAPYFRRELQFFENSEIIIMISLQFILIMSLFVLGGDFWEKLRGLFIREAKISLRKAT